MRNFNIARLRLASQRLIHDKYNKPADVVRWFGGVQSQDFPAAKWAVGLRLENGRDQAVQQAFDSGEIVRTHALRPTWHFLARDDFRWIMNLTRARVHAMNASMYRNMEVDDPVYRKVCRHIINALEGGNFLTRTELAAVLGSKGIVGTGQRMAYIAMRAEVDALICSGPLKGKSHTYALVDERIAPSPKLDVDEGLCTLAARFFASHGPATVHDFSWWSGLTVADGRRAVQQLAGELRSVVFNDKTYWMRADLEPAKFRSPVVHMLPNYDEHVVAYRDHGPSLDPKTPDALYGWGTGLTSHVVLRNGLVIGGWRKFADRDRFIAKLNIPIALKPTERAALKRAMVEYGRFVERSVEIEW